LAEYFARREIWQRKPQIRLVYERWVRRLRSHLPKQGPIIEVGSGSGVLEGLLPEVIRTDVIRLPWTHCALDCMHMPFLDSSVGAIIGLDLLHHVAEPHAFLHEAARILRPGGRLLFIEPFITPVSYAGYRILHHEGMDLRRYHARGEPGEIAPGKDPWEGNLAMANLVFQRDLRRWGELQPSLAIRQRYIFSFFDFQMAAGFKPYAYVPHWIFRGLAALDDWLGNAAWFMRAAGFRIFIVLERL